MLDGGLIIFGGALLLTPGFITDVLGLVLLIPPTRAVMRRMLVGVFARRFMLVALGGRAVRRRAARRDYDVDGTAAEVERPPLER